MDPLDCLSQPPPSASRSISRPLQIRSYDSRNRAGPSTSRSVTPFLASSPRPLSRSSSVFSSFSSFASRVDKYKSDKLQKERYESALRLQTTWEALAEKYGSIPPEEDDEVDLRTGKIVKDRGKLRELEAREFGELQDEPGYEGWEFDSDEDELGVWDERSGLDEQFPKKMAAETAWTKEDENDLASFLRAEAARRRAQGSAESEDTEDDSAAQLSSRMDARETTTRPGIEALLLNEQSMSSSEDEWAAGLVSPRSSQKPGSPTRVIPRRRSSSRKMLEVVIPMRASRPPEAKRDTVSAAPTPQGTLTGLFTPPPSSPAPRQVSGPSRLSSRKPPTPTLRDLFSPSSSPPLPPSATGPLKPSGSARLVSTSPKSCDACRTADGERRKWAARCHGKVNPQNCPFSLSSSSEHLRTLENDPAWSASPGPSRLPAGSPPTTPARMRSHSFARTEDSSFTRWTRQTRHCVVCREAGGERAATSAECPGRRRRSECPHRGKLSGSRSTPTLSIQPPASSSSSERPARYASLSARHASRRILDLEEDDDTQSPRSPSPPWRSHSGEDNIEHAPRPRSVSMANRSFTPLSPSFRRGATPLPRGTTPLSTSRLLYTPKGRSPRRCRYCYVAGGDRALEAEWCRGRTWAKNCPFYVQGEDTPAPTPAQDVFTPARSISRGPHPRREGSTLPSSSGTSRRTSTQRMYHILPHSPRSQLDSSLPPSSPPLASSPMTSRRAQTQILPRTPVSWDSNRGSSISTGTSGKRKSILRQPSQSDFSRQESLTKRARFSLQPDVPSSDPFVCRPGDDDELLLDSSSPAPYSRPPVEYSGPYPREMVVRAADAGVTLGHQPNGHLPESLLRTISMASDPRAGVSKQCALPTPPRSSAPPSSPVRPRPREGSTRQDFGKDTSRAKLMLPPPLPEKCYATPPLSSSSTSSRQRSRSVSLATPTPRPLTIQARVHPATAPKSRTLHTAKQVSVAIDDDQLEWGLDEDAGEPARLWRKSSMVRVVQ